MRKDENNYTVITRPIIFCDLLIVTILISLQIQNFNQPKQFGYNVVFEPEASQEDVFDNSGMKKLIDMALNG